MAFLTDYQSNKLQAYALLYINGNPVGLELTGFQLNFAVNSIPEGSLQLALGRNIATGLAAAIHSIVDQMTITMPVQVYVRVLPGPNSFGQAIETWPANFFRVFTGLTTSTGFSLSRDSVHFNIGLTHWLTDMNFSSALTRQTHQLTPAQLSGVAAFRMGQGVEEAFLATTQAADLFTPVNIQADMWGNALGRWLVRISQQDILSDPTDPNGGPGSNIEALNALQRFEPYAYNGVYRFGVPLQLPLIGLPGSESIANAISEDVAQETFESFASTTLWDKLVGGFGANYRFAVVPLVDTALIVPLTAGMRTPWQTIYGQEYHSINLSDNKPRPVRGVRLLTGIGSMTGAFGLQAGQAGEEDTLAGRYDNPQFRDGMLIHENAPRWSANVVSAPLFGPQAIQPNGVHGNIFFPGFGLIPVLPDPSVVRAGARNIWDHYARHVYITEALRHRTGSLVGKLRFDIAPGSTVRILCVQDKFVRQQVAKPNGAVLFGEVQTVTIGMDSESQQASTAFQVANVRSAAENALDAMSIDGHPLYASPWRGAPLVEDDVFLPTVNRFFEANL